MISVLLVVIGAALLVTVGLSTLRAVLAPRQSPPRVARWTVRLVSTALTAIGMRLPREPRERVMTLCGPLSLFGMLLCWFFGLGLGFALFTSGATGIGLDAPSLGRFFALEETGGARLAGVLAWLSAIVVLGLFLVHLIRIAAAYTRRELLAARLSAQAARPPDAERMLAAYIRSDSRDQLDSLFADWTGWLSDIRCTHVSYPALVYYRPASEMCWLQAATIVLDAAALVEAIAPSWAMPYTRALLDTGMRCFERLGADLGISLAPTAVSLHGREQFGFTDTIKVTTSAGLPTERSPREAWLVFQDLRTQYAPYSTAIASLLLYHIVDNQADSIAPSIPAEGIC
jgi:hypothetical protein